MSDFDFFDDGDDDRGRERPGRAGRGRGTERGGGTPKRKGRDGRARTGTRPGRDAKRRQKPPRRDRQDRNQSPLDFDDEESPYAVEMQAIREATRSRTMFVKVIIIVGIVLGFIAFGISLRTGANLSSVAGQLSSSLKQVTEEKPGKQLALSNVHEWLTADNSPFPKGVDSLIWDGASKVGSSTDDNGVTTEYWSHEFSFVSKSDGRTRQASQLISVSQNIPVVQGSPTILPLQVTGMETGMTSAPAGYVSIDQSDSLQNTVDTWAKAYVGKDGSALSVLVGDPNTDHTYEPANVGVLKSTGINYAVSTNEDGTPTAKDDTSARYGVVSATLTFTPYGSQDSKSATTTIALLVKDPTSGGARIVDWGGDGDLKHLRPYANAVSKTASGNNGTQNGDDATDDTTDDTAGGQTGQPSPDPTDTQRSTSGE